MDVVQSPAVWHELRDAIAHRERERAIASTGEATVGRLNAARGAVEVRYAQLATLSPLFKVFGTIDWIVERLLEVSEIVPATNEALLHAATSLCETVSSVWVRGFDHRSIEADVEALLGSSAAHAALPPPRSDPALVYARIDSAELARRAANRLTSSKWRGLVEAFQELRKRHEHADELLENVGSSMLERLFLVGANSEKCALEDGARQARETLRQAFEELEFAELEAWAAFPPMEVLIASAALIGVLREAASPPEYSIAADGAVFARPSGYGIALQLKATERLVVARTRAFGALSEALYPGRLKAHESQARSPYRRDPIERGPSDGSTNLWFEEAVARTGALAPLDRAVSHGAMLFDASEEVVAVRLSESLRVNPKDRVEWHRAGLSWSMQTLNGALTHALSGWLPFFVRDCALEMYAAINVIQPTSSFLATYSRADAVCRHVLAAIRARVAPYPPLAELATMVVEEIQRPGLLACDPAVRATVVGLAAALCNTPFLGLWNEAHALSHAARMASTTARAARESTSIWDRINVFTDSASEKLEAASFGEHLEKDALAFRASYEAWRHFGLALAAHKEARLVVAAYSLVDTVSAIRMIGSGMKNDPRVVIGKEAAMSAQWRWRCFAHEAFGILPSHRELCVDLLRRRLHERHVRGQEP